MPSGMGEMRSLAENGFMCLGLQTISMKEKLIVFAEMKFPLCG